MKCLILFSGKNNKNIINLSSAENAQRVVKVNHFPCFQSQHSSLVFTVNRAFCSLYSIAFSGHL